MDGFLRKNRECKPFDKNIARRMRANRPMNGDLKRVRKFGEEGGVYHRIMENQQQDRLTSFLSRSWKRMQEKPSWEGVEGEGIDSLVKEEVE